MKMKPNHYDELEKRIKEQMREKELEKYKDLGLSEKRYRWDMLYRCPRKFWVSFFATVYPYLDDTHIDTALRKITGTK